MRVAYRGPRFVLEYARDASGKYPAEEFLATTALDPNREAEVASIRHLFRVYGETGGIINKEKFKKLEGTNPALVEFKAFQVRVIGFYNGAGVLVLTHGCIKKKDRLPPEEIERAHRIRGEHLGGRR